jgi:uncharacterized protein YifE (UPF0438 family)
MLYKNTKKLEEVSVTGVVRVAESADADDVKNAVGDLDNVAVEMTAMETGEEMSKVAGKVSAVFMTDTVGISKDKSKGKSQSASNRYKTIFKKALTSDYMLNIKAENIGKLKDYMTSKDEEKRFDAMLEAMRNAEIAADSVVYKYVSRAAERNTDESYAAAKAYLRAAVENFAEREYVNVKGIEREEYLQKVKPEDRNAIRALLLYMAVNGENISSSGIDALLEVQKLAISSDESASTGTINELLYGLNGLISRIISDPVSVSENEMQQAKRAFTLKHDAIGSFAIGRMIENTKNSTKISAASIRSLLQAA